MVAGFQGRFDAIRDFSHLYTHDDGRQVLLIVERCNVNRTWHIVGRTQRQDGSFMKKTFAPPTGNRTPERAFELFDGMRDTGWCISFLHSVDAGEIESE